RHRYPEREEIEDLRSVVQARELSRWREHWPPAERGGHDQREVLDHVPRVSLERHAVRAGQMPADERHRVERERRDGPRHRAGRPPAPWPPEKNAEPRIDHPRRRPAEQERRG